VKNSEDSNRIKLGMENPEFRKVKQMEDRKSGSGDPVRNLSLPTDGS
jgi:hypothetical protein